jgi:hypothetical protein
LGCVGVGAVGQRRQTAGGTWLCGRFTSYEKQTSKHYGNHPEHLIPHRKSAWIVAEVAGEHGAR